VRSGIAAGVVLPGIEVVAEGPFPDQPEPIDVPGPGQLEFELVLIVCVPVFGVDHVRDTSRWVN